jgi:urea transport system ATP-binding protein
MSKRPSEPALELAGLEVAYGGVPAVRGLDLVVGPGEIVGLVGPNGAGKSSALHAVMGVVGITAGEVRLQGRSVRGLAPEQMARRGVALVPEGRHVYASLTVAENLQLGYAGRRSRDGLAADRAWVEELFPVVREFARRSAGALSGGQQQQLAIARALVTQPQLLVLDEPTEGIQPSIIKDIGRAITYLRQQGQMAILLVEQYFDFARALADTFAVMERGEVVLAGQGSSMVESDVRRYLTV